MIRLFREGLDRRIQSELYKQDIFKQIREKLYDKLVKNKNIEDYPKKQKLKATQQ